MAPERRSHGAKNAITFGQCLSSHLFKAANYALPGCENMLPDQGQPQGEEATFPININTDIFGCSSTCSSDPRCGLQAEYWNPTAVSPIMHLLLFHTQHCTVQSSWPACLWTIFLSCSSPRSTLKLLKETIQMILEAEPRPVDALLLSNPPHTHGPMNVFSS